MYYSNKSGYYGYTPSIKEIKNRRNVATRKKLAEYEFQFLLLRKELNNLRDERKKINSNNTMSTQKKSHLLYTIEKKGKNIKIKMKQVQEEISIRKDRLGLIDSSPLYTHCFICGASIKKTGGKCLICKGYHCPKCGACLCSYKGKNL